jgi:hypothetical protein
MRTGRIGRKFHDYGKALLGLDVLRCWSDGFAARRERSRCEGAGRAGLVAGRTNQCAGGGYTAIDPSFVNGHCGDLAVNPCTFPRQINIHRLTCGLW